MNLNNPPPHQVKKMSKKSNFKICLLETPKELEEVISLGKSDKKTLGLFPLGAYSDAARDGRILIAKEDDRVLGYLLFGVNFRQDIISVTHLCILNEKRGCGIARELFDDLCSRSKIRFRGIRVRCREDYPVNSLWPKFGFSRVGNRKGRGKKVTKLDIWWLDFGHKTLFNTSIESQKKVKVPIDANILYDLERERGKESQYLLSDWLEDDFQLVITSETFNEIEREKDEKAKVKSKSFATKFEVLNSDLDIYNSACKNLRKIFPPKLNERQASDLRQLAKAIGGNASFFITRDGWLLKNEEDIFKDFGIQIIRPSDFVRQQDEILRQLEYEPIKLAVSQIKINRVKAGSSSDIAKALIIPGEKLNELTARINAWIADPRGVFFDTIENSDGVLLGAYCYYFESAKMEVPFFRIADKVMLSTLGHCLTHRILTVALKSRVEAISISETSMDGMLGDILSKNGFVKGGDRYSKFNIYEVLLRTEFEGLLSKLSIKYQSHRDLFESTVRLLSSEDEEYLGNWLEIEKTFFPLKIRDINLPTFVVPIKPQWAMQLFEENLAKEDLYGSDPNLIFNSENVYYRACKPEVIKAPARVLWYVSGNKAKGENAMVLSATSLIEEVYIDKPKALFSRFKRLGIYEWKDLFKIAKHKLENQLMAFLFSHTELFVNPIPLKTLKSLWLSRVGKNFNATSAFALNDNDLYFELYDLGMKGSK